MAKLKEYTICKIKEDFLEGNSLRDTAKMNGVSLGTVQKYTKGLKVGDVEAKKEVVAYRQGISTTSLDQVHAVYGGIEAKHLVEKTKDLANMIASNITEEEVKEASFRDKVIAYGIMMDKIANTIKESQKSNISLSIIVNKLEHKDEKLSLIEEKPIDIECEVVDHEV